MGRLGAPEASLRDAVRQEHLRLRTSVAVGALGLHAMLDGLMQNWMLDPNAFDLLRMGRQTIDTYLAGLILSRERPQGEGDCSTAD